MKKVLFSAFIAAFSLTLLLAQNRQPLLGSGNLVSLKPTVSKFDKVEISGMSGKIFVEIGKPQCAVQIEADDNLAALLIVESDGEKLQIGLKNNKNNRLWVENAHITIRVQMPEASVITHEGNGNMDINGIVGRYFRLEKTGNADILLRGSIDALDIKKMGNGNINAASLIAKSAKISTFGNGNVQLNATEEFTGNGSGNGSIVNIGAGKKSALSGIVGNGSVLEAAESAAEKIKYANLRRINVTFYNPSDGKKSYHVKGIKQDGGRFSYGLDLGSMSRQKEYLPIGTKIYRQGKLVAELTEKDDNQIVSL